MKVMIAYSHECITSEHRRSSRSAFAMLNDINFRSIEYTTAGGITARTFVSRSRLAFDIKKRSVYARLGTNGSVLFTLRFT